MNRLVKIGVASLFSLLLVSCGNEQGLKIVLKLLPFRMRLLPNCYGKLSP